MITLKEFRKMLYNYYETALDKCYDVDDPRTWKSVCIKCNQAGDLIRPITCCFSTLVQKLRSNFSHWHQWGQSNLKVLLRFTIARIQTQSQCAKLLI